MRIPALFSALALAAPAAAVAQSSPFLPEARLRALVNEISGDLAFATPRAWLRAGARISVSRVPTSFGPVTYTLRAEENAVRAGVVVPARSGPPRLLLRVRLPDGHRITGVSLGGRAFPRWSARTETIDLSGLRGRLELVVRHARRP